MNTNPQLETTTLGGGCFWCLEPVFANLRGVVDAVAGYSGGTRANPSYEEVCSGTTGHAEVVQVSFDPSVITFRELLEVFFEVHDPTTFNRQGADVGEQYRSIILYHNAEQKQAAEEIIAGLNRSGKWLKSIVTEVVALEAFYPAEDYHQEYYLKNPYAGYCQVVIRPKIEKFSRHFREKLKTSESPDEPRPTG